MGRSTLLSLRLPHLIQTLRQIQTRCQIQHTSDPITDPTATDPNSSDLDICSFSTPAPSSNASTRCSGDSRNYSEIDPTVPDPDPNYWWWALTLVFAGPQLLRDIPP
jgi:hypothetical protein